MAFFSNTFGFEEAGYSATQKQLLEIATFENVPSKHSTYFREKCDFNISGGKTVTSGIFSMPSVAELREHAQMFANDYENETRTSTANKDGFQIKVQNIQGESRSLHSSEAVKNGDAAVIVQAASQFNLLEFPSPTNIPENGISNYVYDRTQGPACAVACAAGTAYRNYLVPVPSPKIVGNGVEPIPAVQRGQTRKNQLNGLADVEEYLQKETELKKPPWKVKNGYVESSRRALEPLNKLLTDPNSSLRDEMISRMRIGIQENTDVTDDPSLNTKVTQTYNSALSIGYSLLPEKLWAPTAKIILDATYEATLLAGLIQSTPGKPPPIVFLTFVGGGVFQNRSIWIRSAMERAIREIQKYKISLDIRIVHYSGIDERCLPLENLDE